MLIFARNRGKIELMFTTKNGELMKKVAILTDSNGGMTAQEARDLGVTVLPMPVYIDKKLYFEGVDLSQERFFELLPGASEVRTSQP